MQCNQKTEEKNEGIKVKEQDQNKGRKRENRVRELT